MWRNWSRELVCEPHHILRPNTTAEVADAVRAAAARRLRIRPVGSGHSFTPLAVTNELMLDLRGMDALLDVDHDAGLVRVEAGIRLGRLADELSRRGLAPENLGDIDVQSIAGAISTGTHGTGATLGNLSSQVVGLRIVDGRGDVHDLDERDGQALRAARVGLGALGVITEVTLRVLPAYTLRGQDRVEPLDEVLDSFDERSERHRHLDVYVFPYSHLALTRTNDVVDEPPQPPRPTRRWVEDRLLATYALEGVLRLGRRAPTAIPRLNRLVSRLAGRATRVDAAHRVFASARDVRFTEMELAVPREHGVALVREILALVERERLPVNFPIEVRSVAADDALLSPSTGRDSVYVAVHGFVGMPVADYLTGVWELAQRYEPRPHWGKRHPATAADLAPRYPEWSAFQDVRRRLDPAGRFTNDHLDRVLGTVTPAEPGPAR